MLFDRLAAGAKTWSMARDAGGPLHRDAARAPPEQHAGATAVDLGISGRHALVCAASKGLGRACAVALAAEGVNVTLTARGEEALARTADEIRKANPRIEVKIVVGDITTPAGREAALKACPNPDILINNAGGPPPGDFRNWTRDDWIKALDANMLTPIELIKATVDGMMARKFGRVVNITSAAVKAPIDVLGLSNGARTGLTGFVAGLSRKTVRDNVTINGLLPGPFDTDRIRTVSANQAKAAGTTAEEILKKRAAENPSGRIGDPEEFGLACAFLCGAKAGFITGQNILLDGGAFPGTL
jgi:3-oxoacyl-[acyl-carrier protein] reductase